MKTYKLKHPITFRIGDKSEQVDELNLRRLTGSDMRIIDTHGDKPMALTLALIDRVASLPGDAPAFDIADKLDIEDVQGLGEWLAPMLNFSPPTGVTG